MKRKPKNSGKIKRLTCGHCGLIVRVENNCSCVNECDIICCGQQMKSLRS